MAVECSSAPILQIRKLERFFSGLLVLSTNPAPEWVDCYLIEDFAKEWFAKMHVFAIDGIPRLPRIMQERPWPFGEDGCWILWNQALIATNTSRIYEMVTCMSWSHMIPWPRWLTSVINISSQVMKYRLQHWLSAVDWELAIFSLHDQMFTSTRKSHFLLSSFLLTL